jgi:hypothetical protein
LIYLENGAAQMFFPNMFDSFFIRENELEPYTLKQALETKKINVELFKKAFKNDSINFDLLTIDFLQFLFNLPGEIGMLSSGYETGHFQTLQPKTTISLSKSNENIDDNNDIYGVSSNEILREEKEELNNNETKDKTKEEEKEKLPQCSKTFFETHTSEQQKESEKKC